MDRLSFLADVKAHFVQSGKTEGLLSCGVRNMGVLQTHHATSMTCSVVEPIIGLVLQGQKSAQYGTNQIEYGVGDVVVVGQTLPMMSAVVDATPDHPFISAYVSLDMQVVRSLFSDIGNGGWNGDAVPGFETGAAEVELIEAMARLFRLRRDPVEEQVLGAAALREVYFRVLQSQHGGALRQMILLDGKANQIAKAIAHIRKEYRTTIKMSELASITGMSPSVFYENFKKATANSPLQYQKDLRLLEAHQMLQQARTPISEIAWSVGYESPAQFSREFSRKFGAPPREYLRAISA